MTFAALASIPFAVGALIGAVTGKWRAAVVVAVVWICIVSVAAATGHLSDNEDTSAAALFLSGLAVLVPAELGVVAGLGIARARRASQARFADQRQRRRSESL